MLGVWAMILGMALAACGDQSSEPPESGKPVVKVGRLICGGHLSLAVVEKKYQRELPFALRTVQNHDWNDVVADMKAGRMAGTFILSPLAMQMIRQGVKAKIVLMADRGGNGFVLSRRFRRIEDLKGAGAVIAVPHRYSQHHVLLYLALKQHHVPYHDVSVVGMPPRDMINALRRHEIDGFVVGEPEGNKSVTLGVGWMAARSPDIWPHHLDHVFILSTAFIERHPDWAQALISALKKAGMFIERHPREAAVIGEDYTGSDAPVFEQVLTDPPDWIDYSDMVPTVDRVRAMARVMVEMGLWERMPEHLAQYVDTRMIERASRVVH